MIYIFLIPVVGYLLMISVGFFLSGPGYSGPASDHFDGKKFRSPGNARAKGLGSVFKWMFTRKRIKWVFVDPPFGEKPAGKIENGFRITFVNHSTFLIQVDGLNILTDPIWDDRASPFSWAGPKRMQPPGINFDDLPKIDIVLLSHNHYDHLSLATLKMLHKKFQPKIFTSLGVKAFLDKKKLGSSVEMDWWDEQLINENLNLVCVPAQHFSGRGMFDRDATLWSGFVIKRKEGNIYFLADTGYNDSIFKEIGRRLAPIKVSIIPIGAYKPEWFMSPIHTSPEESVRIHVELKSEKSIASHFGTFPLGDDREEDSINDLNEAIKKFNLNVDEFIVMDEGTAIDF